jgi:hypothetical protein
MNGPKLCPLREGSVECSDKCAWRSDEINGCVVHDIAVSLARIDRQADVR